MSTVICGRCGGDVRELDTKFDRGRFYCKGKTACTDRLKAAIRENPMRVVEGRKVLYVEHLEDAEILRVELEGGIRLEAMVVRPGADEAVLQWDVEPTP